jgi:hypothetical protein
MGCNELFGVVRFYLVEDVMEKATRHCFDCLAAGHRVTSCRDPTRVGSVRKLVLLSLALQTLAKSSHLHSVLSHLHLPLLWPKPSTRPWIGDILLGVLRQVLSVVMRVMPGLLPHWKKPGATP